MTFHLDTEKFKQSRILVVGDIMLDRYLWGDVKRISPEAPVPLFRIKERSELPVVPVMLYLTSLVLGAQ
jgi:D-beta-D-heptose 7-phosphate kinase/D-beta-D-heptose 1-phosphate adenosyltransferase